MVVWAAVAATLAASAHALAPNVSTTWSIPAMSPVLQLEPEDAWVDFYSNIDDSVYQPGMMGAGFPAVAGGVGARVSIQYPGYNMTFTGALVNGSQTTPVSFEVDGTAQPAPVISGTSNGVYTSFRGASQDLPLGLHTASIGLAADSPPDTKLAIDWAYLHIPVVARQADIATTRCWRWPFVSALAPGSSVSGFSFNGPWRISDALGGAGGQPKVPYSSIYGNQTASVSINLPPSTMMFQLNGTVGPSFGRYTVDFEPPLPIPFTTNTFNSQRRYLAPNQTMYIGVLDPEVKYTVTITTDEDPTKYLGLVAFRACFLQDPDFVREWFNDTGTEGVTEDGLPVSSGGGNNTDNARGGNAPGTSGDDSAANTTSKSNVGAIAGGVVGGVVGAGLLATLLFFLCRRKKTRHEDPEPFVVDTTDDSLTPYKMEDDRSGSGPAHGAAAYSPGLAYVQGNSENLLQGAPNAGYGPSYTQSPHSVNPTSGLGPPHYPTTMQEKLARQQTFAADPNEPMNEETARALLLALQKHRRSTGVSQEEDAGPAGVVPPSYNPSWSQQQSGPSGAGSSGLASPPQATSGTTSPLRPPEKW